MKISYIFILLYVIYKGVGIVVLANILNLFFWLL